MVNFVHSCYDHGPDRLVKGLGSSAAWSHDMGNTWSTRRLEVSTRHLGASSPSYIAGLFSHMGTAMFNFKIDANLLVT